jgi:transcriptional regulator with GAF, ATPase, and Fis domain
MIDESGFVRALASGEAQPATAFAALHELVDEIVGARLFTLMTFDARNNEGQRIYSNMPDAYPVLGTKPVERTSWADKVLNRHEVFVANDIDAIAEVFSDFELIRSLGCESAMNVPIVVSGSVIGTLNCLHEAGHYTPDRVKASEGLKLAGAGAFLLDRMISAKGA